MTQIDRLIKAKEYLEQLANGQDPTTGEPLPDNSAARGKIVHETLRWCFQHMDMMATGDAPQHDRGRKRIQRADTALYDMWSMEDLAQGCHPYFRTPLDSQDPLGKQELGECFAFVARALNNALLAGCFTAKAPFSLPRGAGANVPISQEPVELTQLLEKINALREDETAVRPLTPNTLEPYLASQGLLVEAPRTGGRKTYLPAPGGEGQDITQEECSRADGTPYTTLVLGPQAQRYVVDHLEDIAAYLADPSRWVPPRQDSLPIRQIDVLKRAKGYLDQLSAYTDPLTGEYLAGVSVAQEESVHRLLASCAQDLEFMLLADEPQLHPDGSHRISFYFSLRGAESNSRIKSRDAVAASILGVERLARGCHPDVGTPLEPQDPLCQERLRQCFAFVGRCLRNTYVANYYTAMAPFFLPQEARSKIHASREPVTVTTLVGRINAQLEDRTAVRGVSAGKILAFQASQSLVQVVEEGKHTIYRPTRAGEKQGITMKEFVESDRSVYTTLAFDAKAQQYVIDHLGDIIADQRAHDEDRKRYLAEKLQSLEESFRQPRSQTVPSPEGPIEPEPAAPREEGPEVERGGAVKQIDILRRAWGYLDKLAQYMDPFTGEALSADSAARDESVHKLLCFCRGDLVQMGRYDSLGVEKPSSVPRYLALHDYALRQENLRRVELLAQGCHPGTETALDPLDPLGQERLRKCFAFVAQSLYHALSAGFYTAKAPFSLTREERARIAISQEPISLSLLLEEINARREDDTAVLPLTFSSLQGYLLSQGLLTRLPNNKRALPSPEGEALGIVCVEQTKADGSTYLCATYGPVAQQYIVDHLADIAAFQKNEAPPMPQKPLPLDGGDPTKTLGDAFRHSGEKQLDALKRAEDHLTQLCQYTDPLTGEYWSDGLAARDDSIHALFEACVQVLEKVIWYDTDGHKSSAISDTQSQQRNAQGMELLVLGCHPDTGAALDPQEPLIQEGLRQCFAFVARCLYCSLNAGVFTAKAPFALTREERSRISISPEPILISALVEEINAQREDDTAMRTLTAPSLREYLVSRSLLAAASERGGKNKYIPTPQGKALGIIRQRLPRKSGGYGSAQVAYGPAAQQFVVDHLDDIAAFQVNK